MADFPDVQLIGTEQRVYGSFLGSEKTCFLFINGSADAGNVSAFSIKNRYNSNVSGSYIGQVMPVWYGFMSGVYDNSQPSRYIYYMGPSQMDDYQHVVKGYARYKVYPDNKYGSVITQDKYIEFDCPTITNTPSCMRCGSDGNIYVFGSQYGAQTVGTPWIMVFNPDLEYIRTINIPLTTLYGMTGWLQIYSHLLISDTKLNIFIHTPDFYRLSFNYDGSNKSLTSIGDYPGNLMFYDGKWYGPSLNEDGIVVKNTLFGNEKIVSFPSITYIKSIDIDKSENGKIFFSGKVSGIGGALLCIDTSLELDTLKVICSGQDIGISDGPTLARIFAGFDTTFLSIY